MRPQAPYNHVKNLLGKKDDGQFWKENIMVCFGTLGSHRKTNS